MYIRRGVTRWGELHPAPLLEEIDRTIPIPDCFADPMYVPRDLSRAIRERTDSMRQRMAALAGAAIVMAVSAAPALAQSTQFTCTGKYTVTENGSIRSSSTNTFTSGFDVTGWYSRTYTFWGRTYTATSDFSCKQL